MAWMPSRRTDAPAKTSVGSRPTSSIPATKVREHCHRSSPPRRQGMDPAGVVEDQAGGARVTRGAEIAYAETAVRRAVGERTLPDLRKRGARSSMVRAGDS